MFKDVQENMNTMRKNRTYKIKDVAKGHTERKNTNMK